ncbi:type II toxin-antitoxin system HicA family toxin [Undibacterium sp. TC9W]|uniref:type II toxin-antitoxin system HicA family toxin n=1 Tax=Undibacterium sp. TC9W TaxID=3413053 RepID=UPI003BF18868
MKSSELIAKLKSEGWVHVRTESSHWTFKHSSNRAVITVKHPQKDIPLGTLRSILKIAGMK